MGQGAAYCKTPKRGHYTFMLKISQNTLLYEKKYANFIYFLKLSASFSKITL